MKKKLFVDKNICTGCRYCEGVCYLVHSSSNQVNPRRARMVVHLVNYDREEGAKHGERASPSGARCEEGSHGYRRLERPAGTASGAASEGHGGV